MSVTLIEQVLTELKKQGATEAEVVYSEGSGVSISCREGEVDTIENNVDKSMIITAYKNQAKGSASTAVVDDENVQLTIQKALTIAGLTEADEAAGLADKSLLATDFKDLGTYFDNEVEGEALVDMALAAHQGAIDYAQSVGQSITIDEANVQLGEGHSIYANSNDFLGEKHGSNASASVVGIAEKDGMMEREYWWDAERDLSRFPALEDIGQIAAQRTLERLGSRKIKSCKAPVLFDPAMAKSLIGHMLSAISGSALYQEASFLKNDLNEQILPEWLSLFEDPFVLGGFASRNFDSNGVQTKQRLIIESGTLTGFLLSVYSARRLGLETTGNAGGAHNIMVQSNNGFDDNLIKTMDRGLFVTSMMGQGVNAVTGDYSRGASGFWVENGEIQFPVSELTIAGNLKDMFSHLVGVGADFDLRSKIHTGSWLIEEMTIAGD
ncbi:metalloprotease PmbA [Marinicella sp. S1101]|uniref:metalloprotease PmbA n=1 Tax=Marinicella marina TaxID=2996016 RepID=UPI002260C3DE|nr:metalloprotease PmbA [Marinicella marina]MCX7553933.1 metalloprotease PmbA [Marinicella marina]